MYKTVRQKICFQNHEKKCIVCGEENIVDVHHLDGNKYNDSPLNLIPICPTCHRYWHSRFYPLISGKIEKYVADYISELDELICSLQEQ